MAKRPSDDAARYLRPYLNAVELHGGGFPALLWASPASQAARFAALANLYDFTGKSIVDIGCGRADFLDYLLANDMEPNHYVGIEAVEAIAQSAERKQHRSCTILHADFVREPRRMFVGADAAVCCGSLNTLSSEEFYQTLRRAFDAAAETLVFNFLCSPKLAAAKFLTWHRQEDVRRFLQSLSSRTNESSDYFDGDCSMIAWK
ncbi:MAG TPA: class I SAM-dependent methyltransferase [Tepidisphaeraceae bacterium]|nr:class I SAM-dependent methyltransferase [Tepidisphaeraceae bacterium]